MAGNLPGKKEIIDMLNNKLPLSHRKEEQKGTNCEGEIFTYFKSGKEHRIFVKKSFLKGNISKLIQEYTLLKSTFGNIVPNQTFIHNNNDIFAFCVPIDIKADILLAQNKEYLIKLFTLQPRLLKQLKFFVRKYQHLISEGKILDLYGKENLIVSSDNKLYYVDSFLLFQEHNNTLREESLNNLTYLQNLIG